MNGDSSALQEQLIYLDFDGATGIDYKGPASVNEVTVKAFETTGKMLVDESTVIDAVFDALSQRFQSLGVTFTDDGTSASAWRRHGKLFHNFYWW